MFHVEGKFRQDTLIRDFALAEQFTVSTESLNGGGRHAKQVELFKVISRAKHHTDEVGASLALADGTVFTARRAKYVPLTGRAGLALGLCSRGVRGLAVVGEARGLRGVTRGIGVVAVGVVSLGLERARLHDDDADARRRRVRILRVGEYLAVAAVHDGKNLALNRDRGERLRGVCRHVVVVLLFLQESRDTGGNLFKRDNVSHLNSPEIVKRGGIRPSFHGG